MCFIWAKYSHSKKTLAQILLGSISVAAQLPAHSLLPHVRFQSKQPFRRSPNSKGEPRRRRLSSSSLRGEPSQAAIAAALLRRVIPSPPPPSRPPSSGFLPPSPPHRSPESAADGPRGAGEVRRPPKVVQERFQVPPHRVLPRGKLTVSSARSPIPFLGSWSSDPGRGFHPFNFLWRFGWLNRAVAAFQVVNRAFPSFTDAERERLYRMLTRVSLLVYSRIVFPIH